MITVSEDLLREAMKRFGYEIRFKDRKVKDISAVGYLWLARQVGIESVDSELLHYSWDGKTLRGVVKVTVTIDGEKYSALADCDDRSMSVRSPDMLVRAADTIAMKRAIARALGIDREELQKYEIGGGREEEEAYTPAPAEPVEPVEPAESAESEEGDLDW